MSYGRSPSTQVDATTHGPYRAIVGHVESSPRPGTPTRVYEALECGHRGQQVPVFSRTAAEVQAEWLQDVEDGYKVARKRRCYTCLQVANRG